jgi:hypothetical protein
MVRTVERREVGVVRWITVAGDRDDITFPEVLGMIALVVLSEPAWVDSALCITTSSSGSSVMDSAELPGAGGPEAVTRLPTTLTLSAGVSSS